MTRMRSEGAAGFAGMILAVGLMLASGPALALGSEPEPAQAPACAEGEVYNETCKACAKACETGSVWDCGKKACVAKSSRVWDDEMLYTQAISLVRGGYYREAHDLLWTIKQRQQPKVLNYIGYTTRKLGDVDRGIAFYHKALALDPNYSKAREYLGEGYLQKDDLAAARGQLEEIALRCGRDCAEYEALADAIAVYITGDKLIKTW